jgi:hypothetical protein
MVRRICPKQSVVSEGMRGKWVLPVQSMHNVFMQGPFEETGIREKYYITEAACQQVGEYCVFSQRLLPFLVTKECFVLTPTREGVSSKSACLGDPFLSCFYTTAEEDIAVKGIVAVPLVPTPT